MMMNLKKIYLSFFAIFVLSATAAFASATATVSEPQLTQLERQVRKELVTLPRVGVFDNLAFQVSGDTVTLYGQVVQPSSRKSAEKRVAKLNGVNRVVNNIEVLPLSGFDDRIRVQAYNSIYNSAGLYRYLLGTNPSLRIIVNRGHITLEGVVANRTDARLAYFAVNSIPSVFSVTNNLRTDREAR
jgi:hyperosmotically inducible periplasmic protein